MTRNERTKHLKENFLNFVTWEIIGNRRLVIRLETRSFKEINEKKNGGDLECEEIIMRDKERFGRVRTGVMKQLREQYGKEIADRALFRINKRVSQNSLRIKKHLNTYDFEKLE